MENKSFFEKHPNLTMFIFLLVVFVLIDQTFAFLFIKDRGDYSRFRGRNNYFHHHILPNQKAKHKWGGRVYNIYSNSLGFKDEAVRKVALKSDDYRILFLGDSFVEGEGCLYEETFVGKVGEKLKSQKVEVLNAGVTSYSPKLYYAKTKYLVEEMGLDIDEMFVFIDVSDINNEMDYKDYKSDVENPAVPFKNDVGRWWGKRYKHFIRNYSFFYNRFRNLKKQIKTMKEAHAAEMEEGQMQNLGNEQWSLNDEAAKVHPGWEHAFSNMEKLIAITKSKGIKLTIVTYPWPENIKAGRKEIVYNKFWKEFAKRNNVAYLDLFQVFVNDNAQETIKEYYIDGDCHWNPKGHDVVTEELLKVIKI